jgi:hypothetical protein
LHKIIYALRKNPVVFCFESGKFSYTRIGRNPIVQLFDRWVTWLVILLFASMSFISLAILVYGKNIASVVGFVLLVFYSFMLATQLRQSRFDQMISNLIVRPEG